MSGLTVGNYSATITITDSNAGNSPQTIPISLTVNAPHISCSATSFSHHVTRTRSLGNDTFTVANTGVGTLNYSVTDNATWLSVGPANGASTGVANPHSIVYTVSGLAVGTYTANISITSSSADNSPQTINVTAIVDPVYIPGDMDGDLDVDQTDFGLLQRCLTGPGVPQTDPACSLARLDGDVDVDADDVAIFVDCFAGPGVQGDPNCH